MKSRPALLLLLFLFLLQSSCYLQCGGHPIGSGHTAGHSPMAVEGPQTWTINGQVFPVKATYYLALPEGLQYTIDYELPASVPLPHQDDTALAIAFPLMEHAYRAGLYNRTDVSKLGTGHLTPSRIGVALYHLEGWHRRGYATALSVDQIKLRLAATPNPTNVTGQ